MSKVLAAVDNSLAAKPVLATAKTLGTMLGAEVEALHVPTDERHFVEDEVEAAGLHLATAPGPVLFRIIEAGRADDVVAVVIGARGTPGGPRPLGGTALAVATSLPKPVLIVPPDTRRAGSLRKVLVPVEGESREFTPRAIVRLAEETGLDAVVLHVHEEASLPAFTDQPQHEYDAWTHEFLRRYCPWGVDSVKLVVRVGRTAELLPLVAEEEDVDVIALGWAQKLAPGRASVVQHALDSARVPVLLVPVDVGRRRGRANAGSAARAAVLA